MGSCWVWVDLVRWWTCLQETKKLRNKTVGFVDMCGEFWIALFLLQETKKVALEVGIPVLHCGWQVLRRQESSVLCFVDVYKRSQGSKSTCSLPNCDDGFGCVNVKLLTQIDADGLQQCTGQDWKSDIQKGHVHGVACLWKLFHTIPVLFVWFGLIG